MFAATAMAMHYSSDKFPTDTQPAFSIMAQRITIENLQLTFSILRIDYAKARTGTD
jgi:hypothetical protein